MTRKLGVVLLLCFMQLATHAEVHIVHGFKGCSKGASETNDLVVRELCTIHKRHEKIC